MKPERRRAGIGFVAGLVTLASTGWFCGDRTSYDANGTYNAVVTLPDGTVRNLVAYPVSRTGLITSDNFTRLCDIQDVTWGLPSQVVNGELAALRVHLDRPLCRTGATTMNGRAVLWGPPPGEPELLTGIVSDDWTVTGTLTVTAHETHGTPHLDVGEEAVIEVARGTFRLEGTGPDSTGVLLEDGSFEFRITARKWRFDP